LAARVWSKQESFSSRSGCGRGDGMRSPRAQPKLRAARCSRSGWRRRWPSPRLIAVMSTAVRKVHLQNGIWVSEGGFEYNAVLIAALTLLAETGPGRLSLDAAFAIEKRGVRWGLAALTGGAIASTTTIKLSQGDPSGGLDAEGSNESPEAVARAT